ncbi:MFS transporter [Deltaproteobacteria bacterium TL4]
MSLSIILFFRMFGLFLIFPVFSVLALELKGATPALIGLAFGAYALTQACLQIPFGIWSDYIGRKPVIIFGLILFTIGSILAAVVDSIYGMIVARFLQGAGAISSTIFALIADLTRPEVRTRANAGLGASIGMAFGIAMVTAPFLGYWFGLSGIFWIMTAMGLISLLTLTMVPNPERPVDTIPQESTMQKIYTVLKLPPLRVINLGAFVCSMGLSGTFFMIPLVLHEHGFEKQELWKIYLPMLLFGIMAMIPAAIIAEVKNRFKEVMLLGIVFLLSSAILFGIGHEQHSIIWFIAALFTFFMGFNIFEPLFPSLVTRMTTPQTKGTASGMYNFSQFIGHSVGAIGAGFFYKYHPFYIIFITVGLELLFFYVTLSFKNPKKREESEVQEVIYP